MTDRPLRLAVVGGFSSGKSALINALLGRALAPMGDTPVTAVSHRFGWAAEPTATFVYQDGRQEERPLSALSMLSGDAAALARVREVRIGLPMSELQDLEIWDTPGFGSNMLSHELAARKALQDADVALWVTPIDAALNRSERDKLEYLRATETPVLLVVNKADLAEDKTDRDEAIAAITQDAGTLVSQVVWLSATLALADPASPALSGMDRLQARLADLRLQQRARLRARVAAVSTVRPMNANDVACPTCRTIGSFDDRFCVCGRSLADQHHACPRCTVDNTVNRPRCRGCNLVFESWTSGAAFAARAEEEVGRCLLVEAQTSLELAVEALPENEAWSARRDQVATARVRVADLMTAADRCSEGIEAVSEWTRAIDLAVGLGVARAAAAKEVGARGLAWARRSHADPESAVAVLEWWLPQGIADGALLRARVADRDQVRASVAKERAERAAVEAARQLAEDELERATKERADLARGEVERAEAEVERAEAGVARAAEEVAAARGVKWAAAYSKKTNTRTVAGRIVLLWTFGLPLVVVLVASNVALAAPWRWPDWLRHVIHIGFWVGLTVLSAWWLYVDQAVRASTFEPTSFRRQTSWPGEPLPPGSTCYMMSHTSWFACVAEHHGVWASYRDGRWSTIAQRGERSAQGTFSCFLLNATERVPYHVAVVSRVDDGRRLANLTVTWVHGGRPEEIVKAEYKA